MNEDSELPEEYGDYSKATRRDFGLSDKDRQFYKELNKIRYKFDKGYISEDKYIDQINCPEFYGFLSDYEWSEISKRAEKEKQRKKIKDEEIEKKIELRKEETNDLNKFLFIAVIIYIIVILIFS